MIFTVWKIGGRRVVDATGAEERANSPTEAKEKAFRRGIGWGNGQRSDYVGLAAVLKRAGDSRHRQ